MLSCRDIAAHADEIIQRDGPWHRRVAVRVHLLMCDHCRRFVSQYRRVTALVARVESPADDVDVARVMEGLAVTTPSTRPVEPES